MWLCASKRHLCAWLIGLSVAIPTWAQRAIWMWEPESYAALEQPTVAQDSIQFLLSKNIHTLYLYADAYQGRHILRDQPQRYADLITRLHAQGIRVHALLGSWYLHTERYVKPSHRAQARAMFQQVLDYNAGAPTSARFDGISLDIEPHLLDEWDTHKIELLEQFIELSHIWMQMKQASGQTLAVGIAMPFWWDGIAVSWRGVTRPTSEHLQGLYDHVALMAYRDHALGSDGILSHSEDELNHARRIGKTVWVGVETAPNEIRKVSFHHLREVDLERELTIVEERLRADPAFGGIVLHHFASYRAWLQKPAR